MPEPQPGMINVDPGSEEVYVMPVSIAQQRLWILDQLQPGNTAYNLAVTVRLTGPLHPELLERSLREVIRRHETLRSTFSMREGAAVQLVSRETSFNLPVVDLRRITDSERNDRAIKLATEEAETPFNLATGPLLRVKLFRVDEQSWLAALAMHHIISDGWSLGVFLSELSSIYTAFSLGRPSPLPELPIQYADYAAWQREQLSGEVLENHLRYWRERMDPGAATLLSDAFGTPATGIEEFQGTSENFRISRAASQAIYAFARKSDATLFQVLIAAFQTLLHRYTGREQIVVGSPFGARPRNDLQGLIGIFVNTLPLRADFGDDPTFPELLARVRDSYLGAYAHQDIPVEMLIDHASIKGGLRFNPFFQVTFSLDNVDPVLLSLPGIRSDLVPPEKPSLRFDLELHMEDREGELLGSFLYRPATFDPASIGRMAAHMRMLLEDIASNPARRVSEFSLLDELEQQELRGKWNGEKVEYPEPPFVHRLFEHRAAETPEATALLFKDEKLTYSELNRRANRIAHYLLARGAAPETPIGVCLERSSELIACILGIWKAGGIFVPLDPRLPADRLAFMLEDTQVPLTVTTRGFRELLPEASRTVILEDVTNSPEEDDVNPSTQLDSSNIAYLIYTSGSTGKPKGVEVEHRNLTNTLLGSRDKFGFSSRDVMWCLAPFSFDIFLWEMMNPLTVGATSLLVAGDQALDTEALVQLAGRVTCFLALPGLLRQIVGRILNQPQPPAYPELRMVFTGGDVVSPELLNDARRAFPMSELEVLYGPTETTLICTSFRVPRQRAHRQIIGKPLSNMTLRVYDRHRNLVPVGIGGEIYVGGECVSRGYRNRKELTAERYIVAEGERFYRTGDLGRRLASGDVEFLGRIDSQVKIRGFRIELGEVEAALNAHDAVKQAVVVARADANQDKELVAYIISETPPSWDSLRAWLRERLPEYMVPSMFVQLDHVPLTHNGKVDWRSLPAPSMENMKIATDYVAPRTALENAIAEIWRTALGVEQIGLNDNFFDLGAHSLTMVRVHRELKEKLNRSIPIVEMFRNTTVSDLAAWLDDNQPQPNAAERGASRAERRRTLRNRA